MDCATNLSQIEKIYADSYNHDVKAPMVYADGYDHLYADAEFTKPVDYKLLKDLFFAGVVVCYNDMMFRVTACVNSDDTPALSYGNTTGFGYDPDLEEWVESGATPA